MVQGCLQRMQQCYEACSGQADRIVEAVSRHFRRLGQGGVSLERADRGRQSVSVHSVLMCM
jgi:hypothetical protein